jgi:DNA-binding NtrC family response regulator
VVEQHHVVKGEQHPLIGESQPINNLKYLIQKIAPLDTTVLLLGETGTGKEVAARLIHDYCDARRGNFVAVHAAGITETLLESALFGHEKGAFTGAYKAHKGYFESAQGGVILLDEIGEVSMATQVKLLRVLQDKQFYRVGGNMPITSTARIIAATNKNLAKMVKEGKFREDLYYRLNVITLDIAPLRERRDDIPLLARHFLAKYTKKHVRLGIYLKPETVEMLQNYTWPGNVRELENVIERLIALSDSDWIGPEHLPAEFFAMPETPPLKGDQFLPFAEAKNLFERDYILDILKRTGGNISGAARIARMPRQNLHVKIKKYNLRPKIEDKYTEFLTNIENLN